MNEIDTQQRERTLEALRGGLRGRFAGAFCVLQSSVEALSRYLDANASAEIRAAAEPMLAGMTQQIAELERLSANAADLALGSRGLLLDEPRPIELRSQLTELCAGARQELALRGRADAVLLEDQNPFPTVWALGDEGLLACIFANLLSNSLTAGQAVECRVTLYADGSFRYTDNAGGMDDELAQNLLDGTAQPAETLGGEMGLSLVGGYLRALGWSSKLEPSDAGFGLHVHPRAADEPVPTGFSGPEGERRRVSAMLRAVLNRELNAVLGVVKKT